MKLSRRTFNLTLLSTLALAACGDKGGGAAGGGYDHDYTGPDGNQGTDTPDCGLPTKISVFATQMLWGTLFLSHFADNSTGGKHFQGNAVSSDGFGRDVGNFGNGDCGPMVVVMTTLGKVQIDSTSVLQIYQCDINAIDKLYRNEHGAQAPIDRNSTDYHQVVAKWFACQEAPSTCDTSILPGDAYMHRDTAVSFGDINATDPTPRVWLLRYVAQPMA